MFIQKQRPPLQGKFVRIWIYPLGGDNMKYRAVIKKSDGWWIGWLIDLPGVNGQEKTKAKLIESLRVGAEDMLDTEVPFELGAEMTMIDISDPTWTKSPIENLTVP